MCWTRRPPGARPPADTGCERRCGTSVIERSHATSRRSYGRCLQTSGLDDRKQEEHTGCVRFQSSAWREEAAATCAALTD